MGSEYEFDEASGDIYYYDASQGINYYYNNESNQWYQMSLYDDQYVECSQPPPII